MLLVLIKSLVQLTNEALSKHRLKYFLYKNNQKENLQTIDLLNSTVEEQFMKDRSELRKEEYKNILEVWR